MTTTSLPSYKNLHTQFTIEKGFKLYWNIHRYFTSGDVLL
jgi:hypothetical protein